MESEIWQDVVLSGQHTTTLFFCLLLELVAAPLVQASKSLLSLFLTAPLPPFDTHASINQAYNIFLALLPSQNALTSIARSMRMGGPSGSNIRSLFGFAGGCCWSCAALQASS